MFWLKMSKRIILFQRLCVRVTLRLYRKGHKTFNAQNPNKTTYLQWQWIRAKHLASHNQVFDKSNVHTKHHHLQPNYQHLIHITRSSDFPIELFTNFTCKEDIFIYYWNVQQTKAPKWCSHRITLQCEINESVWCRVGNSKEFHRL